MKPSTACAALVKESEGLRLAKYLDPAGKATIGYGHLIHEWEDEGLPNTINEAVADALLVNDLDEAAALVDSLYLDLSQGQFDALVDFVFNLGFGALRGSTLLRRLRAGDFAVADPQPAKSYQRPYGTVVIDLPYGEFNKWVWVTRGGVTYVEPGLVTRRNREGRLWRTGEWRNAVGEEVA